MPVAIRPKGHNQLDFLLTTAILLQTREATHPSLCAKLQGCKKKGTNEYIFSIRRDSSIWSSPVKNRCESHQILVSYRLQGSCIPSFVL